MNGLTWKLAFGLICGAAFAFLQLPCYSAASTAALSALQNLAGTLDQAKSLEYTSRIQMAGSDGTMKSFYAHVKIEKPNLVWASFSSKALDDANAIEVASNNTAVYEFDPKANVFSVSPPVAGNLVVKQDFMQIGQFLTMERQFLGSGQKPMVGLFPFDDQDPLTLSRRSGDLPGTQVVISNVAGTGDTENLVKVWISNVDQTPKRLSVSRLSGGSEAVVNQEDFQSLHLNSSFRDGDFALAIPGNATHWQASNTAARPAASGSILAGYYNVIGLYNEGVVFSRSGGGLDGYGGAFPSNLLGSKKTWNGTTFTFGPQGAPDAVSCVGQTINLPAQSCGRILMLGCAVVGTQPSQSFTVTYTDSTTSTFTQSFSDWAGSQAYPGESIVVSTFRNWGGFVDTSKAYYIYGYTFTLEGGKTPLSIALPTNDKVKILALALAP